MDEPNTRRNVIFFLILIKSFGLPYREVTFFMKKRPNIQSNEEYLMYFWALEVLLYAGIGPQPSFKFIGSWDNFSTNYMRSMLRSRENEVLKLS